MAIAIVSDPSEIWRELEDFKAAVDNFVKQQIDLAERERKEHIEFVQTQQCMFEK